MSTSKSRSPSARWSPKLKTLPALSLRQPWAWLVVNGYKDIENRSWRTVYRGPLLIHASSTKADFTWETVEGIKRHDRIILPEELDIGGIVGIVDVIDCVQEHKSRWFSGEYGWVLANPRRLPYRECKGFVKFFIPSFPKRKNAIGKRGN
ncbi:MAG: ASCH domain-containing protein [Chthoniobacterales bacterium]